MKATLLVLPVFSALFIAVFSLLAALSAVFFWIEASNAVGEYGLTIILPQLVHALPVLTILASVLSLFFILLTYSGSRNVGFTASLTALLFASLIYGGLFAVFDGMSADTEETYISSPFEAGYIYPLGEHLFYGESIRYNNDDMPSFSPVALVSTRAPEAVSLYSTGTVTDAHGTLRINGRIFGGDDDAKSIPLERNRGGVLSALDPPPLAARMAEEAGIIDRSLGNLLNTSLIMFAAAVIVQALFVVTSWTFIRSSPWPFFNAIVALLLIRGFFFLHRIATGEAVSSLLSGAGLQEHTALAPYILLALVSFLFILWSIAFHMGSREGS